MIALVQRYWKPLAALLLVVSLCAGSAWLASSHTDAEWQAKWTARDLADAQAAKAFTEQQRRIELQRQGAIDAIQEQAQQDIATAQRNASIAAAESKRLQDGIADAITRLQADSGNPGATISSKTRASTNLLLAELFREIDAAAGNYAAEADRARAAGLTCERAYDAVRATSQQ
ncbi:hypothetical protein [Salmonella phage PT1]|nr:hypothetical protein [Salmonella phage PT1]